MLTRAVHAQPRRIPLATRRGSSLRDGSPAARPRNDTRDSRAVLSAPPQGLGLDVTRPLGRDEERSAFKCDTLARGKCRVCVEGTARGGRKCRRAILALHEEKTLQSPWRSLTEKKKRPNPPPSLRPHSQREKPRLAFCSLALIMPLDTLQGAAAVYHFRTKAALCPARVLNT